MSRSPAARPDRTGRHQLILAPMYAAAQKNNELLPVHKWMFSALLHEIARRAKLRRIDFNGEAPECPTIGS